MSATNEHGTAYDVAWLTIGLSELTVPSDPITMKLGRPVDIALCATNSPHRYAKSHRWPKGVGLDGKTGRITGTPKEAGTFPVKVRIYNAAGGNSKEFGIVVTE